MHYRSGINPPSQGKGIVAKTTIRKRRINGK